MGLLAAGTASHAYGERVDWSKIEFWSGEGDCKAALVVQFDTPTDSVNPGSLIWGFRWSSSQTVDGEEMIRAIAADAGDLVALIQYTGTMGSTLDGLGFAKDAETLLSHLTYDYDGASSDSRISFGFDAPQTFMGQTEAPGVNALDQILEAIDAATETHVIEHPLNQREYGYPAYDYDWWKLVGSPANVFWNSGWYDGYWSFWTGDTELNSLAYSGMGMTSVDVEDGDVHGWKYINFKKQDSADYGTTDESEWLALNYNHLVGKTSGVRVDEIMTDMAGPVYYRPDGIRAYAPLKSGLYIKVQNNKSTKVIVK